MDFVTAVVWLSMNCFYECRNEPQAGQVAVAQVVLNRAKKCKSSAKETILLDSQFSWTKYDLHKTGGYVDPLDSAGMGSLVGCVKSSIIAMSVDDLTGGATFYHTTDISPYWANGKKSIMTIGHHTFYGGQDFRCR
jgi:hypothetical protein